MRGIQTDRKKEERETQTISFSRERDRQTEKEKQYLIMTPITLIGLCYNRTNLINICLTSTVRQE